MHVTTALSNFATYPILGLNRLERHILRIRHSFMSPSPARSGRLPPRLNEPDECRQKIDHTHHHSKHDIDQLLSLHRIGSKLETEPAIEDAGDE